jgi:hypothetical protein
MERTRNRAVQYGRKWMGASRRGPHDWSVLSPTAVHRDKRTTSWHAGPFAGGLCGTGRGSTYVEAQHRAANGQPKVNGGHATGVCWAPRALHWDRRLHCACYFNRGPTWKPSRPPARQNHTGFGVAVLNCMQEFKNRPFWTAPSGLKRAACSVPRAGGSFRSSTAAPRASLWKLHYEFIFIMNSEVYVPSCSLWGRELGQQVLYICFDCLVRIFLRAAAHIGDIGVVTCKTSLGVGGGIFSSFPPTPRLGHARMHAFFDLRVSRCWWRAARWLHLVPGGLASPPSIDWVAHARYHLPIQFSFSIIISNLNVKSEFQTADRYVSDVQNQITGTTKCNFKHFYFEI